MNDSLIYLLNVPQLDVNNNNTFTFKVDKKVCFLIDLLFIR